MTNQLIIDESGHGTKEFYDNTGVTTTDGNETNLFVNTTGKGNVTNGFIDLGDYAGGTGNLQWFESAGAAGTLKIYGALTAATTYQAQIGANQTITASGGDAPVNFTLPKFLRVTITRTAGNITVRYKLICKRGAGM